MRVEKLKAAGLMTPAGLAKIDPEVRPAAAPRRTPLEIPSYFKDALAGDDEARLFFDRLAPSYQRGYLTRVDTAKREETRLRRLAEALSFLRKKQKLGMK